MRRRTVTARRAQSIAAALLATSVALLLAGCGNNDGSDDPSGSGPEAQNVAAGADDQGHLAAHRAPGHR